MGDHAKPGKPDQGKAGSKNGSGDHAAGTKKGK